MNQIVTLLSSHSYLALAVLIVGYLMRIFAADSKFPVTIPARWAPAVTLLLGQLYGVLTTVTNGASWVNAIESGVTASLIVVILQTMFTGAEPTWFKIIAFVLQGGGAPPAAGGGIQASTAKVPSEPPKTPPTAARTLRRVVMTGVFASALLGCPEAKTALSEVQTACLAVNLAASVIPPGTPASVVAADLELACDVVTTVDSDVQAIVTTYEADQAEAGTATTSTVYVPSPLVVKKRALKAVSSDAGTK